MSSTEVIEKINIVDGCFTPAEAAEIIDAMIEQKINFHKVKSLQQWLGDCNCPTKDSKVRIQELSAAQEKAKAFFAEAHRAGRKITISGKLELSFQE